MAKQGDTQRANGDARHVCGLTGNMQYVLVMVATNRPYGSKATAATWRGLETRGLVHRASEHEPYAVTEKGAAVAAKLRAAEPDFG